MTGLDRKQYRSWYHDPKQVEHLVLMLEEKTVDPKTGKEGWKYGSGHAYRAMFPTERTPWANTYTKARVPTLDLFKDAIQSLRSGKRSFGSKVPEELVQRFANTMKERAGRGPIERESIFWDDPHKLVAMGLMEYCGLTEKDTLVILKDRFGYSAKPNALRMRRHDWRNKREFPYENSDVLKQNTPRAIVFVEYLRLLTGFTLSDVRSFIVRTHSTDDARKQHIEQFMSTLEKYQVKNHKGTF
jgi:hypothetical protein